MTDDTIHITPNQIVGYNLFRARTLRRLTQEEAAELLEPFLGTRWSKATFSAAERSYGGDRVRNFTADDIYAFALAFEVPAAFFLLPPEPSTEARGLPTWVMVGEGGLTPLAAATTVLADQDRPHAESGWIGERVSRLLVDTPEDERHESVRQVTTVTRTVLRTVVAEQMSAASTSAKVLRDVADTLDAAAEQTGARATKAMSMTDQGDDEGDDR